MQSYHCSIDNSERKVTAGSCWGRNHKHVHIPSHKIYLFFFLYTYILLNNSIFSLARSHTHLHFHVLFLSHSHAYTDSANAEDQNTAFGSRCSLESSRTTGSINWQGRTFVRRNCARLRLCFLKELIDSQSLHLYPLILSHLRSTASWTGDRSLFLGLRGRKNTGGGERGNKRLQSGPLTCIHLYGVRVHIQYISLMCACTCAFAYILNNNNNNS